MGLQISIVIPTHNRSQILRATLGALARQTLDPTSYEVILVADGCQDDTAAVVKSLELPYALTMLEQPGLGAAAARNRGAGAARAPLLLFLDDDKEAAPGLVEAHLTAHQTDPHGVVLGYYPIPEPEPPADLFEIAVKLWWDETFAALADPAHRFTFKDLCAGNVSMSRQLFEAAGGFDARFPGASTEDYELGVRLLRQRASFYFVPAAFSFHHESISAESSLRRAFADGRGHALLSQKHPELFWEFRISQPSSSLWLFPSWYIMWQAPALLKPLVWILMKLVKITKAVRMRGLVDRFYGLLEGYAYWTGVRTELKSLAALHRFAQTAPRQPKDFTEINFDVATDWSHLDTILYEQPVDAVSLYYHGAYVGRMEPLPAAEPLRAVHVRHALIHRFGGELLRLIEPEQLTRLGLPVSLFWLALQPHRGLPHQAAIAPEIIYDSITSSGEA